MFVFFFFFCSLFSNVPCGEMWQIVIKVSCSGFVQTWWNIVCGHQWGQWSSIMCTYCICFSLMGVGIQCCKRSEVVASLTKRQSIRVDPFASKFRSHELFTLQLGWLKCDHLLYIQHQMTLLCAPAAGTKLCIIKISLPCFSDKFGLILIILWLLHSTMNCGNDLNVNNMTLC